MSPFCTCHDGSSVRAWAKSWHDWIIICYVRATCILFEIFALWSHKYLMKYSPDRYAWWRHQIETFSALLALCAGKLPVNSPHKGQWRGELMFSLICAWTNGWVNNRAVGDLRRHHAHYDVIVVVHVSLFSRAMERVASAVSMLSGFVFAVGGAIKVFDVNKELTNHMVWYL